MNKLPHNARVFVWIVWGLGIASLVLAGLVPQRTVAPAKAWELGLLILLGILAGGTKIRLTPRKTAESMGLLSLGFALIFAALLRLGPTAALWVGGASTLASCLFPRRQPFHQILFNLALNVIATFTTGQVFLLINGGTLELHPVGSLLAVMLSSFTFFLISTGAVAAAVALSTDQNPPRLWRDSFLWTAPSYFASASAGTLAILILGRHVGTVLLFVTPVACLTYLSYTLQARSVEEKQHHIEELEVNQAQLSSALEREHRIAEALQRALLIHIEERDFPGLDVASIYEPALNEALVGGDFFDVFSLPGGETAFVVGDVSGKGLAAATRTAEIKFVLRGYLRDDSNPACALERLNRYVHNARQLDGEDTPGFIALSLIVVDARCEAIRMAAAGAEPPLALRTGGETLVLDRGGMVLGVDSECAYDLTALPFAEGDTFLMFTDGFTEVRKESVWLGYEGFTQLVEQSASARPARKAADAILEQVRTFSGGELQDDACLLMVHRPAPVEPCSLHQRPALTHA